MKITGELLKAERLKRDLSIQDVAYALKLNSKTITAIESGDLDQLPAKTFIRGFVKSYADYLKINTENVLKQFQEEMGSTRPIPKRPPPVATDQVTTQKIEHKPSEKVVIESKFGKNHFFALLTVLVLLVLIAVVNNKINDYKNETVTALQTSTTTAPPASPVGMPASVTTEATSENANAPESTTPEQTATPTPTPAATPAGLPATPTASETTVPAQPKPTAVNYAAAPTSPGKPIELLIEAKKEVTIEYAKGNSTQFTTLRMLPQTFQIIRSQSGLHLRTQDGSAIHLTVNGVLKGSAANSSTPTVLSF